MLFLRWWSAPLDDCSNHLSPLSNALGSAERGNIVGTTDKTVKGPDDYDLARGKGLQ